MRYLLTGKQMKQVDRYTIEQIGILSLVLMERAALAVAEETMKHAGKKEHIWVACGTGNNGADGIAAARMMFLKGYDVLVLLAGNPEHGTAEYHQQMKIAQELGMNMAEFKDFIPGRCDVLVDAVFGVGLDREIGGEYRELLELLNSRAPRFTVAVDIPSGIHSDSGKVMGIAVKADVTVTFGWQKLGTCLYPGKEYSGTVVIDDIGFPEKSLEQVSPQAFTYEEADWGRIPKRPAYSNKGSFGKVLIIAGSSGMSGAAYLSASAAYAMGAGLVKVFTVEENRAVLQQQLPEAIIECYDPEAVLKEEEGFEEQAGKALEWADLVVLGPGIGQGEYVPPLVKFVLTHAYVPIVLDADGLNAVAKHQELTGYFTENIIITPHLGEMSRLTGKRVEEIRENLHETALEYSGRYGITCVLKDAVTVIGMKGGRVYYNSSGNSAMAKAGSGDVLTGLIAGLLGLGMEESEAAALGVYLHGCAGDRVFKERGQHGLLARDLVEAVRQGIAL